MKTDIRIFKDSEAMSIAAAEIFVQEAAQAVRARGRFLVALSGGSTPSGLYRLLADEPFRSKVDWAKTFIFWGDERCVPPDDEGSSYHQAHKNLLKYVPISDENVQRIKGELEPAEASNDYTQTLKRFAAPGLHWPRFDLVLLGMGEDGHTASLFPGSPVAADSPTLAVTAEYQGRPAQRVTLTPPVFNSARTILFLVTGASKASTLKEVLRGAHKPELFPAQRIQPTDGKLIWLVDEGAGNLQSGR
ncbi:MAG: 6-phosphogluconolactonase [Anaerolineales bacterium]|nr:6-phosphogluconolactonase [Anaerolineales bacterium]